ncbi:MAG: peptidoglycan-binding protein [Candidatus Ventricola sp.]
MKNRGTRLAVTLVILCLLATVFAVPVASAASYSKVYGQTLNKVRVRESASTNAAVIDNIVKDACVYVTTSKTSGATTFVQVRYRTSDGTVETGWVCQSDASNSYVKILSATQAMDKFSVSGGDLPSKRVGTFTAAQRKASASSADNAYLKEGTSGEVVKDVQTKLKALGFYSGSITGNVGDKTKQAIKDFQAKYGLTVDGVAGPQTIAKIDAVYSEKKAAGTLSSGSGSTPSYASSSGSGLKLGSSGSSVRDLQTDLTTLGYYWADITGSFGSKTETAVKLFQSKNGLTPGGVAGTKTLNAIASAIAKKGGSSSSSSSGSSSSSSTLKLNSQGTKVSQLQTDLKQLGYYYADITGNFGEKTEAAVKLFQSKNGLTADGVAGTKTLEAISAAVAKAGGSSSSSSSSSGLKLGSTGSDVSALQQNLTTLGYYYGDITGHYGSMTQAAVTKFQKARGITADGVAGTKTIEAIASAIKSAGGSPAGSGAVAGTSLREGDSGTAVTELQTMLKKLDYYYGSITGNFGSLTKQAVRKFQDDNGLTVDGVAGVNTINKLRSLTGTSSSSSTGSGTTVTTANSYGRITKDNVNLRSSYSTSSAAKASLSEGTKCRITKQYTVGGEKWYYITVTVGKYTYQGYVRSDMIELISESEYGSGSSGEHETLGMIRVTGNNVSLRTEPSSSSTKAGTANTGDVFYYIDSESGWFRTQAGYWISKDYAKVMTADEIKDYTGSGSGSSSGSSLKYGSTGSDVLYVQTALKKLGYYSGSLTGHYGNKTAQAVMDFQRDHGLSADGVCGAKTMAAIASAESGSGSSGGSGSVSLKDTVYDLSWNSYKNAYVKAGLTRGNTFMLTDLQTGYSFKVYVQSVGNHADVEPATAADTATMCRIYGVSSAKDISYVRRAMLATIGSYQFACSMYGEPHGSEVITNNNYDGQFCIHFRDCKTSGTQIVYEENQKPIDQAVTYVKAKGKTVLTTPPSALQ